MNTHSLNGETERKKPGRKAESPAQRLERLEKEMIAARRAVAEAEQRKLAAIGRAVIAEAEGNPAFREQLRDVLRQRVTAKADRAAVASLLE